MTDTTRHSRTLLIQVEADDQYLESRTWQLLQFGIELGLDKIARHVKQYGDIRITVIGWEDGQ